MHNPVYVLENKTHSLLSDFEIQTDHLNLARQTDLIIINKKERTCRTVDFAVLVDHKIKLQEGEMMDLKLAWELKKFMEHETDVLSNCN